ncbi:protein of unknown function [Onishia taeanensis]|uniref:DUF4145 domain-containing protein n=1 Tax=Onishia taeanensis TaxID=284577 RepID=A0A1G7NGF7_9GAMM|nr:DUF4145 domain-containing protein [Halomonas taeanensis]SDF72389.1 protein of unknown function [Halomonas taeanensis]
MSYVTPEISKKSFNCPLCGVHAHMLWYQFSRQQSARPYTEAKCSHCDESSLWRIDETQETVYGEIIPLRGTMLFPDTGVAPLPDKDMPDDVKSEYQEAARISGKSPRGAAALLRLGLQKLCRHLGKDGKNINSDIRSLSEDNILPPMVIKVADTVRITGNNAVHPGEMSEEDFDHVSLSLFDLLNFIVRKAITEPRELESIYQRIPENPRAAAEKEDAKRRGE